MVRPIELPDCVMCDSKRYLVCIHDNGFLAVERCDECTANYLTDAEVARIALNDGIECRLTYPCYLSTDAVRKWLGEDQ